VTAVVAIIVQHSNSRLNYAENMKKKAFALMALSADLHMELTNSLPKKLMSQRRENAMDFGTMDAAVMDEDANSDMKREVGKTQPAF
jgi:hypothetical protein